jgi:hypothetical protein
MKEIIYSEKYKDFTINIMYDTFGENPLDFEGDDIFIVYDHRDFCLKRDGFVPSEIYFDSYKRNKKTYKGYWIIPLTLYSHSGISLSVGVNKGWDYSFMGFVLVKKQAKWSYKEEQAKNIAKDYIISYNEFLSGEIYCYDIIDKYGENVESCCGYLGDYKTNGMITDCKSVIDGIINHNPIKYSTQLELNF